MGSEDKDILGSASSGEISKDSCDQSKSNANSAVLLDDEGHEIPSFQALHLDMCMPTSKDRRYLNLSAKGIPSFGREESLV